MTKDNRECVPLGILQLQEHCSSFIKPKSSRGTNGGRGKSDEWEQSSDQSKEANLREQQELRIKLRHSGNTCCTVMDGAHTQGGSPDKYLNQGRGPGLSSSCLSCDV